ncbi:MAG: pyridoxamine 5'-phosphate oxidase family protein [Thermodesulfobacteriota bacterium]
MIDQIQDLIRRNSQCVLATSADNRPHCSLMAYAVDDACREIYLVTHKNTRKYRNLTQNPHVSLLIDSRGLAGKDIQALTVEGRFCQIPDPDKRRRVRAALIGAHPHLEEFISHSDAELLCITVSSFLLLNDLTDAHFISVS